MKPDIDLKLQNRLRIITEWEPKSEIWPFSYGVGAVSGVTTLSALVISTFYRKRFNLKSQGRMMAFLPNVLIPSFLCFQLHFSSIIMHIISNKTVCPVCLEIRGMFIQAGTGIVYPLILGSTSALIMSQRYFTEAVPPLSEWKEVLKLVVKKSKKVHLPIMALSFLHIVTSSYVVNKQLNLMPLLYDKFEGKNI